MTPSLGWASQNSYVATIQDGGVVELTSRTDSSTELRTEQWKSPNARGIIKIDNQMSVSPILQDWDRPGVRGCGRLGDRLAG